MIDWGVYEMTAKEKLKMDAPALVSPLYDGGAVGCPHKYGYLDKPDYCDGPDRGYDSKLCVKCWNREIPDNDREESKDCATPSEPHILDSGNRRKFESGAVRDIQEGKGRCDLLPLDVVAGYMHGDAIFYAIDMFQNSGDVNCLYHCLSHFEWHWGQNVECAEDPLLQTISTNYKQATMLLEVSKHFEEGAKKYGDNNWRKGIPVHCYIDSAVRHYLKFLRGDKDEPHDRAFCWNIMCCIWTCEHHPELNEYSKEGA